MGIHIKTGLPPQGTAAPPFIELPTREQAAPLFRYAQKRELRRRMKERLPLGRFHLQAECAARDEILSTFRFCNNDREDDKTSRWFSSNIRAGLKNEPEVFLATVAFRWFNRIETWATISAHMPAHQTWLDFFREWDSTKVNLLLRGNGHAPWVTGSYLIKTPDGMDKLDGVLWCIDEFVRLWGASEAVFTPGITNLEWVHAWLVEEVPFMGPFMAYQVISDLLHTYLLKDAPDRNTWACPGPGTARGLARLLGRPLGHFRYNKEDDRRKMIALMRCLLPYSQDEEFWPGEWWEWELQTVSHVLCEFDKYERVRLGEGRPRQLYRKGA